MSGQPTLEHRESSLRVAKKATNEDISGEGGDVHEHSSKWDHDHPAIDRILSDAAHGSEEERAMMALTLGMAETSIERAPPSANKPQVNKSFLGTWEQQSMEADKLEAILKIQGYSWPIRKVALSTKLNMTFEIDADGETMVYSSKVPLQGEVRIKCVDGAGLEMSMMGTKMSYHMKWVGEGDLEMLQENISGHKKTSATITQKYDAANDKLISENSSVEGFYTRTFKRVK